MAEEQLAGGENLPVKNRRILVLYGSETGNSQDLAVDLERMTERLHFRTDVFGMDAIGLVGRLESLIAACGKRICFPRAKVSIARAYSPEITGLWDLYQFLRLSFGSL
jgi:hypothetical protein